MDKIILDRLQEGCVIPAHPLAILPDHQIDVPHQRALTRYYLAAGAGGLAVGVHTTQFAIHDPKVGLLKPVLELAAETAGDYTAQNSLPPPIMIAGVVGPTPQALSEAHLARETGYHLALLSLKALARRPVDDLIDHCRRVADIIPLMGFYLQQSISGMTLPPEFWRRFVEIPNVRAIKIAPFSRYRTLDVLEAVAASGRSDDIALYTGNDDTILHDLLTTFRFNFAGRTVSLRMVGGLLGQWACWTSRAVAYLRQIHELAETAAAVPPDLLTLAAQLTLANKAIFDAENNFAGCIPGILYVLQRQGLVASTHTIDPHERMSPQQARAIDSVISNYPHLTDDDFVRQNLHLWLS